MGVDPTLAVYKPQTAYRAYRDIFTFLEKTPQIGGTHPTINTAHPVVTQQLNTLVYSDSNPAYDTYRYFCAKAYVVGTSTTGDHAWNVSYHLPLYSATPVFQYDVRADWQPGGFANPTNAQFVGKGFFLNTIDPSYLFYTNAGPVIVMQYVFPRWDKVTGKVVLTLLTVTRTGTYTTNYWAYTYTRSYSDIFDPTTSIIFGSTAADRQTPRRRVESISAVASGTYIMVVSKNNPDAIDGYAAHSSYEFYKITGATAATKTTASYQLLAPSWQWPITAADYTETPSVAYNMEWMEFAFSSPYDGPGLINNNEGDPLPPEGLTVTVFNGNKYGKAYYFVEKDGFCSDIKEVIPTYGPETPDYVAGMGTTSFRPTGLVQVGTKRHSQWSGLYLSGEFTRVADDGVSFTMSCYLIGNALATNSDTLTSGARTGSFGWSFGARNFFLDDAGARVALPLPAYNKYSLEFDFENYWYSSGGLPSWPAVSDSNDPAVSNNSFMLRRGLLMAFGNNGKVFAADMTNTRFHNPPFVAADDILEWEVERSSGGAETLSLVVPATGMRDRFGWPIANVNIISGPTPLDAVGTTVIIACVGAPYDKTLFFAPGTYFQLLDAGTQTSVAGKVIDFGTEIFEVVSSTYLGSGNTSVTVVRGAQFTKATAHAAGLVPVTIPAFSKFESGNSIDLQYWGGGEVLTNTVTSEKIGGFILETKEYPNESGLVGNVTLRGMDVSSSNMATWSSPIDMFFDPKSIVPQGGGRRLDGIPSLKYLIQKTPGYPVDTDGLNGYESWSPSSGYSHWGVNRPSIFFNAQTAVGNNPLNKHRIKFGSSVDGATGIQAFGSLFAAYDDGTMAGAFIGPPTSRPIYAASVDSRTTYTGALSTGGLSTRFQDGTTNKNRVNILGSALQTTGEETGFQLAPGGRQLIGQNGPAHFSGSNFATPSTLSSTVAVGDIAISITNTGGLLGVPGVGDYFQIYETGCTTSRNSLDTSVEVMKVNSASYSANVTTLSVSRAQLGTTATAHNTTGKAIWRIIPGTSYLTRALDTIFGSSTDYTYGLRRIGGAGAYLYENDVTINQDTAYDFAVKVFGRYILVYYKKAEYAVGALDTTKNKWTLATYYRLETNADSWLRPAQKRYTGFAVSTDSWFKKNDFWLDSEMGQLVRRWSASQLVYGSFSSSTYMLRDEYEPTLFPVAGGGGGAVSLILNDPRRDELPMDTTVWGGLHDLKNGVFTGRWWDYTGRFAESITDGVDPVNPNGYFPNNTEILKWSWTAVPSIISCLQSLSGFSNPADALGIPYRTSDVPGATISGYMGYMMSGDEVFRWRSDAHTRVCTPIANRSVGAEWFIAIPSDIIHPYSVQSHNPEKFLVFDWRDSGIIWKGFNPSGSAGMGKWSYIQNLSNYGSPSIPTALHMIGQAYYSGSPPTGYDTVTVAEPITFSPAKESDIFLTWPRAQLGTEKLPHSLGDYICAYPVKNAQAGGFPVDYGVDTVADSKALAIKNSVMVLRNSSFQGPYRSVQDSIHQTSALCGTKSVFSDKTGELQNGTFIDTLQSVFSASGWSLFFQAKPQVHWAADFKNAVIKFRGGAYYLSITAVDWAAPGTAEGGPTGTKALTLSLTWQNETTILEKVTVPLLGMSNTVALTAPIRVSLSGDTLSVDVLDEQLWSFDLGSYTDGGSSAYYSTQAGTVEVKTTVAQTACYWHSPELSDEVEATVVDRGSVFGSALSFLMNGRWVKTIPNANGFLSQSRFLTRYSPYDLSTGIMRSSFTIGTNQSDQLYSAAGHVESSGGTFAELANPSWLRQNGYVFREAQNRLVLTANDARLESRLQLRSEREASERFVISGHILPRLYPEHGIPWTSSGAPDYVVDSHRMRVSHGKAVSEISCRKYYVL